MQRQANGLQIELLKNRCRFFHFNIHFIKKGFLANKCGSKDKLEMLLVYWEKQLLQWFIKARDSKDEGMKTLVKAIHLVPD